MRRVLPWIFVITAAGVLPVVAASPAGACSCAVADATWLDRADAAFIGTFVEKVPAVDLGGNQSLNDQSSSAFVVDEVVKGQLPAELAVTSASSGAACGIELEAGEHTGLVLTAGSGGTWESSLCSQLPPAELLAFAGGDTNPPTPGDEAPPPTVPEGSDSRWFAIVLYVLFGAAGIALVIALVRRPSQSV